MSAAMLEEPSAKSVPESWLNADDFDLHRRAQDVDVWSASLDDLPPPVLRDMESTLQADERSRARSFHFERDRRRYVAGRGILRRLLGQYLGCAPRSITLTYGANGKPELAAESVRESGAIAPALHFNVSHSEGLALYAFTRVGEVGIDLEFRREVADWAAIAASVFSAGEQAGLKACPASRRQEEFLRIWTQREARLKAAGGGLGVPAEPDDEVRFHVHPLYPASGFAAALAVGPAATWATLRRWPQLFPNHGSTSGQWPTRVRLDRRGAEKIYSI